MPPEGYRIRPARRDELAALPGIEREAGRRFQDFLETREVPEDVTPMEELARAHRDGHVWVAAGPDDRPVGFAYGSVVDGSFHLEEVDVLPSAGRRGLGTALVREAIRHAGSSGYPAVTLTTFRNVPWNAPFYAKLGFEILPTSVLGPELAAAFSDEGRRGLPVEIRVVMRLDLEDRA